MKTIQWSLILSAMLLITCTNPTSSTPEFSLVEYRKSGGWIATATLRISPSGHLFASQIAQASRDTIALESGQLPRKDQNWMHHMFEEFDHYDPYYAPDDWYTDGNTHRIIYTHNGIFDTVIVYEPRNANIPNGLTHIIETMELLWQQVIGEES